MNEAEELLQEIKEDVERLKEENDPVTYNELGDIFGYVLARIAGGCPEPQKMAAEVLKLLDDN